jgi:nucleotide-binding universal stress UspA family protein
MHRIVIAVDGSPAAEEALEVGLDLAREQHAKVTLVHVRPATEWLTSAFGPAPEVSAPKEPDEVLDAAVAAAAAHGVECDTDVREGFPEDEIVRAADAVAADLVVVGSRGLSPVGRFVLGSVSRGVLRECRRPVLVVRAA